MKYSTKALFLTLIIIFSNQSYAIILDQSAIDKKALEIENKLTRERYLMYGLTTIAVAHEIYQWIPMLKDLFAPQSSIAEKQPDLSFFQSIKAGFKYIFYTKEGWVSLIQSGFSIGGIVVISQMGEQYIHPDTLRWYINAHAPYQVTIKLMQENLHNLQTLSNEEECQVNKEMLQLLNARLVRQAERMCAYVTYKIKRLDDAEKIVGERAKNAMLKTHHNYLSRIAEQLDTTEINYNAIERLLDGYQIAIAAQVNHFALIEGETNRDRAVVKRQMKQKN
jgi:hypothetical protein